MDNTNPLPCYMLFLIMLLMNTLSDYKEYIYAVYRERSFSKAAQVLHTSQPWLSAKVKEVEQKLGTQLFDRSTSPLTVTPAGEYYVAQARKMMQIEAEMDQYFEELRQASAGRLRVGSSMFFCTYVLPALLAGFQKDHPGVTLTFEEGATQALSAKLLKGELDVMLEAEKPEQKGIRSILWEREEILLAVPARFRLNSELADYCYTFDEVLKRDMPGCRKPAVPLERFADQPFLLLDETNDIHDRCLAICRNAGFAPSVKLQLTQMMTAYYLVCEGQGVSMLRAAIPESVTPTDSVVFYQLGDELALRNIYLSYIRLRDSNLKKQLIAYLEDRAVRNGKGE